MILCVGTTPVLQRTMTFERLALDAVNRAIQVQTSTGGKSLNVARVLTTLGEQSLATGFLAGQNGRRVRSLLDEMGVAHDFVDVAGETRQCVTMIDRAGGTATELIEEPQCIADAYWRDLGNKFAALATRAKVIVFSGSLPPGGPDDFYANCVRAAGDVRTIVDARERSLNLAMSQRPFVVKPNRAELAATLNVSIDSEDSLRDAMRRVIDFGPRWVVVTAGPQGAWASDGTTFWRITIPRVKVVSAIGSGDSFAAGLAAGIAQELPMSETLRLAASCSVANVLTDLPACIRLDDLRAIEKQVTVREC